MGVISSANNLNQFTMGKISFSVKCGQDSQMAKETFSKLPTVIEGKIPAHFGYKDPRITPITDKPGHYKFSFELDGMPAPVILEMHKNDQKVRIKAESGVATAFNKRFKNNFEVTVGGWLTDCLKAPKKRAVDLAQDSIVNVALPTSDPQPHKTEVSELTLSQRRDLAMGTF